jgi:stage V sporulation protein SpoVS
MLRAWRRADFWDRVLRPGGQGRNVTKVGAQTNPREIASQVAAQGRAAVDCPTLQCIGPSATNQAIKAVAIARTYLAQSDASGQTVCCTSQRPLDGLAGRCSGPSAASALALILSRGAAHAHARHAAAAGRRVARAPLMAHSIRSRRPRAASLWTAAMHTHMRVTAPPCVGAQAHPDVVVYPEFIKLDAAQAADDGSSLSALQLALCKRVRRTSVDKEGRSLKVSSNTEAKSLAGAIASCTVRELPPDSASKSGGAGSGARDSVLDGSAAGVTRCAAHAAVAGWRRAPCRGPAGRCRRQWCGRVMVVRLTGLGVRMCVCCAQREGSRVELTAIGAGSVNQAIKAIAIARQYVEEEAIDLCFRPEFVEIAEAEVGAGDGAQHGAAGPTSALRIIVLVEQT